MLPDGTLDAAYEWQGGIARAQMQRIPALSAPHRRSHRPGMGLSSFSPRRSTKRY
jgi:hypothetical protein